MIPKRLVFAAGISSAALIGTALLSLTQDVAEQAPADASGVQAQAVAGLVLYDPQTWLAVGPDRDPQTYASANAPEQVEQRKRAALAMQYPLAYMKLYPPTAEQLEKAEEGRRAALDPVGHYLIMQSEKSAEQLARETEILWPMLHPIEAREQYLKSNPEPSPNSEP
jgi:hypothetical protein